MTGFKLYDANRIAGQNVVLKKNQPFKSINRLRAENTWYRYSGLPSCHISYMANHARSRVPMAADTGGQDQLHPSPSPPSATAPLPLMIRNPPKFRKADSYTHRVTRRVQSPCLP
jgi:hypothetical protein